MSKVGQRERETQNRVVKLFKSQLILNWRILIKKIRNLIKFWISFKITQTAVCNLILKFKKNLNWTNSVNKAFIQAF